MLRRGPSEQGLAPMISPTLCPTLSTVPKLKFFPRPMAFAVGPGLMMINYALWSKALLATDR